MSKYQNDLGNLYTPFVFKLLICSGVYNTGLSGALAAIATMPFDVAKTTMQCGTRRLPLLQSLAMTVEEKGVKGLYAGLVSIIPHFWSLCCASQFVRVCF